MANNKFNIILGGKFDENSLIKMQSDAEKFFKKNPINIKLDINTNLHEIQKKISEAVTNANKSIDSQVQYANKSNLTKSVITSKGQTDTFKAKGSVFDKTDVVQDEKLKKTTLDYESPLKRELKAQEEVQKAIEKTILAREKEARVLEENQAKAANKAMDTQYAKDLKAQEAQVIAVRKIDTTYSQLSERIQNLGNDNIISKKKVAEFNAELAKIRSKPIEQQATAFKNLNQRISDSKKQVMGFGQMLKTAYEKFAKQQIATSYRNVC